MSSTQPPKIIVIGAGINGVACAVCIQQCLPGAQVEIVAETFSPNTTSDGSGGFWEPYVLGETDHGIIRKTSKITFDYLMDLALSPLAGEIGVQVLSGYTLLTEYAEEEELIKSIVDGYRRLTPKELARFPTAKCGFFHTTVQVDVVPYMAWLTKKFTEKGGKLTSKKLLSLNELAGQCDLIINCCGLGARDLLDDEKVFPTRGQVWRVRAPWIKHFYTFKAKHNGYLDSYILPGTNDIVVGGTAQVDDWRTEIDETDSINIWKTAQNLLPPITNATPVKVWAGLRPSRTTMKLEPEVMDIGDQKMKVIHNYGHGGSGITLHWGCALEVTKLALQSLGLPQTHAQHLTKSRM